MSDPGATNKGKHMVQSKLPFASTSQPNARGKLPDDTPSTSWTGTKRKLGKGNGTTVQKNLLSVLMLL